MMEQSVTIGELATALAAFQGEVRDPYKGGANQHMRTRYVSLPDVWNAIRPVMPKHGLALVQMPRSDGDRIGMTTQLTHSSGEWLRATFYLAPDTHKSRNAVQAAGSTLSYLRRYSALAVLGLSESDDDAQSARTGARPATAADDSLGPWRQKLAACPDAAALADWFADARAKLSDGDRRKLGAALQQTAHKLGTSIDALREVA